MLQNRKSKLYMHDLILMIVGFYGGYLTALDSLSDTKSKPQDENKSCQDHEYKAG